MNRPNAFEKIHCSEELKGKTKSAMLWALHTGGEKPRPRKRQWFSPKRIVAVAAAAAVIGLGVLAAPLLPWANTQGMLIAAGAQNLMHGIKSVKADVSGALTVSFKQSVQDFSARLFQSVYTPGKNTLISPLSASLALSMTANGAAGNTRRQFETVLGRCGQTVDSLNQGYKALADDFTHLSGGTKLSISNSLWVKKGFQAYPAFLHANADYYGAGAHSEDFSSPFAAKAINAWVSEKTGGKIKDLVNQTDPYDVMFLLNAVYFDAKWEYPFDKDSSFTGDFTTEDGGKVPAAYMGLSKELSAAQGKTADAVLLPYKGNQFAMLCILPDKSIPLKKYIASMTADTIPALLSQATDTSVSVTLPKLNFQVGYSLKEPLKTMGLSDAFDDTADFSALGKWDVYISSMEQKASLQVDETGTRFVVATNILLQPKCTKAMPELQLDFNRPFLAAVIDLKTGLPLLMASVADPTLG